MNKTFKIALIVILLSIALFITVFMIYALITNKNTFIDFSSQAVLLLDEKYERNIKSINIEDISSNISIKETEENQIHVLIYGTEKEIAESRIENETLNITRKGKNFCFGLCFYKKEIIVYVPKTLQANLKVKTVSGNLEISSTLQNVELKTTSGDIKIEKIENAKITTTSGNINIKNANKIDVHTTSGDIRVDKLNTSIEAESVSGNIKIESFNILEDSHIKTISGDVTIENSSDIFVEANTTSGDVEIANNNRNAKNTLRIKTTSGDIEIK